ncbi:hypothetical protein Dda_2893 [Drechslerella dactyloides]|uniref:Zn(2)-C6 fungal-type domain-containing protein n=1 Tax=Drechslerella dactyloides TaxID=74499 RepID=A0AAD6NMC0_DREDA|nr:hypothetical protein Dda_2893 [Drechslerella dactyloides]
MPQRQRKTAKFATGGASSEYHCSIAAREPLYLLFQWRFTDAELLRCDRALPTCGKCRGRNLECPGYGLVLKWGQGVASRGKLAGKSYPIRNPEHAVASISKENTNVNLATPPKSTTTSPKTKVPKKEPSFKQQAPAPLKQQPNFSNIHNIMRVELMNQPDADGDFEEEVGHLGGGCCGGPVDNTGAWDDWLVQNGGLNTAPTPSDLEFYDSKPPMVPSPPSSVYSLDYSPQVPDFDYNYNLHPQLPQLLENPTVRELIAHYDQAVAPVMAWIDSPSNPWRKIMIPLAAQSPTLLLALLAVSASHLSVQSGGNHPLYSPAASRYRDSALALITSRLRIETGALGYQSPDPGHQLREKIESDATLAAIIMLTNFEQIGGQTNAWRTHLDAARAMVKLRASASQMASQNDPVSTFLFTQLHFIDVMASTTTFAGASDAAKDFEIPMNPPTSGREELFEDFLLVMHQITRWERMLSNAERSPPSIPPPEAIQTRFESARQRTLLASAAFASVLSAEQKDDFNLLISVYHHSGLLYAWRSLYNLPSTHILVSTSKRELYRSLHSIKDQKRFAVDLVYPLFILGTESVGDENTQEYVEWRMKEAMEVTGFSNCLAALSFLNAYWTQAGVEESWVSFARRYSDQGQQFLAYETAK